MVANEENQASRFQKGLKMKIQMFIIPSSSRRILRFLPSLVR